MNAFFSTRFSLFWLMVLTMCVLVMTGCQDLPANLSFNDRAAIGYKGVTSIYETANTLAQAGKLSKRDAQNVLKQADIVRDAIDVAKDLYTAKDAAANDKLASAIATLNALQTYLARHP